MRAFFDTNVVIYALAKDDLRRQGVALQLLEKHIAQRSFVISTQVLLEAYNVLTRKKRKAPAAVLASLQLLAQGEVVALGPAALLSGLAMAARDQLSPFDALIVQAALEAGCDTLYSEDLQAGRRFGALEVVNPFSTSVQEPQPAAWTQAKVLGPDSKARRRAAPR